MDEWMMLKWYCQVSVSNWPHISGDFWSFKGTLTCLHHTCTITAPYNIKAFFKNTTIVFIPASFIPISRSCRRRCSRVLWHFLFPLCFFSPHFSSSSSNLFVTFSRFSAPPLPAPLCSDKSLGSLCSTPTDRDSQDEDTQKNSVTARLHNQLSLVFATWSQEAACPFPLLAARALLTLR